MARRVVEPVGRGRPSLVVAALVVHLAVASAHGLTHGLVPVGLPAWQNGLVVATTFLGPVVGVLLASRSHPLGIPLFALSMLGSFLVGVSLHFLVSNPDHVHAIAPGAWRLPFQASAVAVAATAALGALVGARSWYGGMLGPAGDDAR